MTMTNTETDVSLYMYLVLLCLCLCFSCIIHAFRLSINQHTHADDDLYITIITSTWVKSAQSNGKINMKSFSGSEIKAKSCKYGRFKG